MESTKKNFEEKIAMPEKVVLSLSGSHVTLKGPKGELTRRFPNPNMRLKLEGNTLHLSTKSTSKRDKTTIGSIKSHIKNMIKGVNEGFAYDLKICSGHFPITVAMTGKELIVKNFLGERVPRKLLIKGNITVKINGSDIKIEGSNKEEVSQASASIEQLTRRAGFDRRIFQDGIYIVTKDGKPVK